MAKKAIITLTAVCLVLSGVLIGVLVKAGAAVPEPGTIQDPLVTKAYLDMRIAELTGQEFVPPIVDDITGEVIAGPVQKYVDAKINELSQKLEQDLEMTNQYIGNVAANTVAAFVPINVKEGQTVICDEGAEFIVRSGSATAIASVDKMGVSNVSIGKDLQTDEQIPLNTLMIIPRSDGRGFKSLNDGTYVMIKGVYTITGPGIEEPPIEEKPPVEEETPANITTE